MVGGLTVYATGFFRTAQESAVFGSLNGCVYSANEPWPESAATPVADTAAEQAPSVQENVATTSKASGQRLAVLTRLPSQVTITE